MSFSLGWLEEPEGTFDTLCGVTPDASAELIAAATLDAPEDVDLVWALPDEFKNQASTNSCVGHGLCNGAETRLRALGFHAPRSSPRQVYTLSNMLLKKTKTERLRDVGTYVRTAARASQTWGVGLEIDWPLFNPTTGAVNDVNKEVPPDVLQRASSWKLDGLEKILATDQERITAVVGALSRREPIPVAGDWDKAAERYNGVGVLGAANLRERIGGHMVCLVGYRTNRITRKKEFLLLNSWLGWGLSIGDKQSLAWVSEEWVKAQRELYRMAVSRGRRIG